MLGTIVNVHVANDLAAETIFGKHTFYNLDEQGVVTGLDVLVERLLLQKLGSGDALSAGIAGVRKIFATGPLVASEAHLVGIDDNYIVATLYERRVCGLVLASEDQGNYRAKTTEYLIGGIDNHPLTLAVLLVGRNCFVA